MSIIDQVSRLCDSACIQIWLFGFSFVSNILPNLIRFSFRSFYFMGVRFEIEFVLKIYGIGILVCFCIPASFIDTMFTENSHI